MHNIPEKKYIFLILGILLIIFGPFVVFFIPILVPMTFFFEKYTWFYVTPASNYVWLSVALLLILICCAILLFAGIQWKTVLISLGLTIISIAIVIGSSLQYTAMSDTGIKTRKAFTTNIHHYEWSDIGRAIFTQIPPGEKGTPFLDVYMKNGDELRIYQNNNVYENRSKISAYLRNNGVTLEYVDKKD